MLDPVYPEYIYICRVAAGITQVERRTVANVYLLSCTSFILPYPVYLGYKYQILYILYIYMCRVAAGITQVERRHFG